MLQRHALPGKGKAVVRVLERLGHEIEFRQAQTCCGQMHYNSGYQKQAASLMRSFLRVFEGAELICIPSSSCVAMMRENFPKIAAKARDARAVEAVDKLLPRIFELSELLIDRLQTVDVGAFYPHFVTLHPPCHSLRSLHVGDKPLELLRHVRGLQLVDLPEADQCCGFGGTFAIKNPAPGITAGARFACRTTTSSAEGHVARSCSIRALRLRLEIPSECPAVRFSAAIAG